MKIAISATSAVISSSAVPVGVDVVVRLRRASTLLFASIAAVVLGTVLACLSLELGPHPASWRPDGWWGLTHALCIVVVGLPAPLATALVAHRAHLTFRNHTEGQRRLEVARWFWLVATFTVGLPLFLVAMIGLGIDA